MKTKVILTLCVVFGLGLVGVANAQTTLIAGSPEDRAYTAAMSATTNDSKIALLLDFEKQFPTSKALPDIYVALIGAYVQNNDKAKIDEVGERAIKADPENFMALMAVSRNYAIEKKNLDRAVQYAQRAVDVLAKKKGEARYKEDEAWKAYLDSTENAAKQNLAYAKSMKP